MTGPGHEPQATTAEATRLWELYQSGNSQHVIAVALGLQLRTVRRYLAQRRKLERLADQDGRLLVAEAKMSEHPHWPSVTVSQVSGIPVPLVEEIRARLIAAGELTADGDWFADAAARGLALGHAIRAAEKAHRNADTHR